MELKYVLNCAQKFFVGSLFELYTSLIEEGSKQRVPVPSVPSLALLWKASVSLRLERSSLLVSESQSSPQEWDLLCLLFHMSETHVHALSQEECVGAGLVVKGSSYLSAWDSSKWYCKT